MADIPLRTPALLTVVAPVFDEEALIEEFIARTTAAIADFDFELLLVNDGSSDSTPELLDRAAAADPRVRVIHLSRNFGHQAALTAGLEHAAGDVVAMIDADLQDPPELIPDMVAQWSQGADVVYAVRKQRDGETAFKLATASWFYKLFDKLAQVDLEPNSGDFRLLDRRALDALLTMTERSRFLRGMTVWVGFDQTRRVLPARRPPRRGDEVHRAQDAALLPRTRRLLLARPAAAGDVRRPAVRGCGVHRDPGGHLAAPVRLLPPRLRLDHDRDPAVGGIQLIALGVIGEYVGRIYDEVKHRPLYIVREELNRPASHGRITGSSTTRAGLPARSAERVRSPTTGDRV